jgi:hypothetical protein
MIQRVMRSGQVSQATRPDGYSVTEPLSYGEDGCGGPLVKHICSTVLTSGHVDVTGARVTYAAPKKFVFISKKQMKWIDANRWYRQGARDRKVVPVQELTPESCSIDNRKATIGTGPESVVSLPRVVPSGLVRT